MDSELFEELRDNLDFPIIPDLGSKFLEKPEVLEKYGLSGFVNAVLGVKHIDTPSLTEMIATYDKEKHEATVRGCTIKIDKVALALALKLPESDVDYSSDYKGKLKRDDDYALFIYRFAVTFMYLKAGLSVAPVAYEIHEMLDCVIDGHPESFDFAGFMWLLVEHDLIQSVSTKLCFYAPHLQLLINSQYPDGFGTSENAMDVDDEDHFNDDDWTGDADGSVDANAAAARTPQSPPIIYTDDFFDLGGRTSGSVNAQSARDVPIIDAEDFVNDDGQPSGAVHDDVPVDDAAAAAQSAPDAPIIDAEDFVNDGGRPSGAVHDEVMVDAAAQSAPRDTQGSGAPGQGSETRRVYSVKRFQARKSVIDPEADKMADGIRHEHFVVLGIGS